MKTIQLNEFSQGMLYHDDRTKIPKGFYHLMSNGRNRYNTLKPVKLPRDFTDEIPHATVNKTTQGVYSFGSFLLCFIGGLAYYKNYASGGWNKITGFQMQHDADRIYAAIVTASTINLGRKRNNASDITQGVSFGDFDSGNDAGVIVCDGINQPWFIYSDGTARQTQGFDEWVNGDNTREYVPIGIKPVMHAGILYMLVKDERGRYTKIVRSVTGRPLDFMVNIDINGNKGSSEDTSGALSVSHSVGLDEITSFYPSSLDNKTLIVSTLRSTWFVIPDFQTTIFGEPTFINQGPIFRTGAVSDNAFVELNSDTVFIDQRGLRIFNDVLTSKNEGKNRPFSDNIQRIFGEIIQSSNACAVEFDSYVLFSVNSSFGPIVVVYDTLTNNYSSVDYYPSFGQIKQFSVMRYQGSERLFGITTNNKVIELFKGATAKMMFYPADFSGDANGNRKAELKIRRVTMGLDEIKEDGIIQVTEYSDGVIGDIRSFNVTEAEPVNSTKPMPYLPAESRVNTIRSMDFESESFGTAKGLMIETSTDIRVDWIQLELDDTTVEISNSDALDDVILNEGDNYPFNLAMLGNNFEATGDALTLINLAKGISPDLYLGGGNAVTGTGGSLTLTPLEDNFSYENSLNKLNLAIGELEYDQNNAIDLVEYLLQYSNNRYFTFQHKNIRFFVLSSGYNSAGAIVEPNGVAEGSKQHSWFSAELAKSTARFNVVVMHHAPYSSYIASPKTALRWDFTGIDLVLTSQATGYERLIKDGVTYVNVYSGNTPGSVVSVDENSIYRNDSANMLVLAVDNYKIHAKVRGITNTLTDQFIIN